MTNSGTVFLVAFVYATALACYLGAIRNAVAKRIYRHAWILWGIVLLLFEFLPEQKESAVRLIPFCGFPEEMAVGYRILELLGSALLFLPGGFLAGMRGCLKGERSAFAKTMILAAGLALICELIQLAPLGKTLATDHFLLEIAGAFAGYALFAVLVRTERMQDILKKILYPDREDRSDGGKL